MSVVLTGWYETDEGVVMLDETGANLNEIVVRLVQNDVENFGHTDMELELHLPNGVVKLVEETVRRMVRDV